MGNDVIGGWEVQVVAAGVMRFASVFAAAGEDDISSAGFTNYERHRVRYDVDDGGRHVETHEWTLRVLSDPGIAIANRASVSFSDRMQTRSTPVRERRPRCSPP
jgi:hypothetical protein